MFESPFYMVYSKSIAHQHFDIFLVKRAVRALQSPAYAQACAKNPLLPAVSDRASADAAFKLLPRSLLALRVSKVDDDDDDDEHAHEGHSHGPRPGASSAAAKTKKKKKGRVKGLWTVRIEQQQETGDAEHYVWLYEGPQWRQKLYGVGALALLLAVVLFPLWPVRLRQGVWYLSMALLSVIGLFFAMSIFRLILFAVTVFVVPPGLWLYPNLFEDVGFFDSFRPVWGWQEVIILFFSPVLPFFLFYTSFFVSLFGYA